MAMAIGMVIGALIILTVPIVIVIAILSGGDFDDDEIEIGVELGAGFLMEGLLLLAAAVFSVGKYGLSWSTLGFRLPRRGGFWAYLFPVPLFIAMAVIVAVVTVIMSAVGVEAEADVDTKVFDSAVLVVMLGILSLALAPIMEETFFRGFLFGGLRGRWGILGGAFASGLLFGLAHFTGVPSLAIVPAFVLVGMLFAWAYHYSGSLFAPMVTHFMWNLMVFTLGILEVGS